MRKLRIGGLRSLLLLLLVLGAMVVSLDPRHRDQASTEAACSVFCLEEAEAFPILVEGPQSPANQDGDIPPLQAVLCEIRESAREPEHAPPRRA